MNKALGVGLGIFAVCLIVLGVILYGSNEKLAIAVSGTEVQEVDLDGRTIELFASTSDRYDSMYGAYGIFVNENLVGYWTFWTESNEDDGGLSYYQKSIDLTQYGTPGKNNTVDVYYSFIHQNGRDYNDHLSNLCGGTGGQFQDENMELQRAGMIRDFALCSTFYYGRVQRNFWENESTCLYKYKTTVRQQPNSACQLIVTDYDGFTNLSFNDIERVKTFAHYESSFVGPQEAWHIRLWHWITGLFGGQ